MKRNELNPENDKKEESQKNDEESEDSLDDYISGIAHDLKGPLISMLGYNDLLVMPEFGEISQQKLEFANNINQSGKMLLAMINNIVDASRIREGHLDFMFEDFALNDLFKELRETFGAMSIKQKIDLIFSCSNDIWVYADHNRIRRTFHNLITNSFRHTQKGGEIDISAVDTTAGIEIKVSDTGMGIPRSDINRIFGKYSRGKREREGTGLGLFIVKKFLEGHNSDIQVISEPERGTTFSFQLPKGKKTGTVELKKGKILLLSEAPNRILFISNILKKDGHEVESVKGIGEGLAICQSFKPDIIIICYNISNQDVNEFQGKLNKDHLIGKIPFILISDNNPPELKTTYHSIVPITVELDLLRKEVAGILLEKGVKRL